jgi:hypothetical protein
MCPKGRIAKRTCLRAVHEHLGFIKGYFQWARHSMTENDTQCRITFSEELLQVMRNAREMSINNLLTADELWFYSDWGQDMA